MKKILVAMIIVCCATVALAVQPNPNGSVMVSNGGGYFLLCSSGEIYYISGAGATVWISFAVLPVPVAQVANWAGTAFVSTAGEVWRLSGVKWVRRADLPVANNQIAAWDNQFMITTTGACWEYKYSIDSWVQYQDLPCVPPLSVTTANLGSAKALYR